LRAQDPAVTLDDKVSNDAAAKRSLTTFQSPSLRPARRVTCRRAMGHDLVECTFVGWIAIRNVREALGASARLGFADSLLWDAVEADLSALSQMDLEQIVHGVFEAPRAPRRWGLLVASGEALVTSGLIATAAEDRGFGRRFREFLDRDRALEWLGCRRGPVTPAPPRLGHLAL
jgi:hypothetical protein